MSTETILTGLISGVLCSLLLLIIAIYWKKIILPWIEDRAYKGTRIDGMWYTRMEINGRVTKETVELKQYGNKITGKITYPEDREGVSHTYDVDGEFRDRTLCLIQKETGHGYQDMGAIVLDFKPGGSHRKMVGKGVWPNEGEIVTVNYTWTK